VAIVEEFPKRIGAGVPTIWGNLPPRNKNFTGRESLLHELHSRIQAATDGATAVLPHSLQGLGGVGKTHLAIEYAYRYQAEYDVVWWVPSEQPALARAALAGLADRLRLGEMLRVDDAVTAAVDALRRGDPYDRWLLIFDNVDEPEPIRALMPHGTGHVIITSRNPRWQSITDAVEVNIFQREESLEFLGRRIPGISRADADRLATDLGDLPLALEQAGALQVETGMAVDAYLELLDEAAAKLLSEATPTDYPVPVAAAWSVSVNRLRDNTPFALELLRRCSFFGPEPIDLDILERGKFILSSPFGATLRDRLQVSRAMRELGRYALGRIDNNRRTIQVHRLIQKVIADGLTEDEGTMIRSEVHQLLVGADPGEPTNAADWPRFQALLPHIIPSGIVSSTDVAARQLVSRTVDFLFQTGDFETALYLADLALAAWEEASGTENADVLILRGAKANTLWALGRYPEAFDLRRPTLETIERVLGPEHEETLKVRNGYGSDLRARGDFRAAREQDEDSVTRHRRVFGEDHPRTLNAANNLAVDYGLTSAYHQALELDRQILTDRRDQSGRDDDPLVVRQMTAVARDMRQAGDYLEARRLAEQAYVMFENLVSRDQLPAEHPAVLQQAKDLSVARRKAGAFVEALDLAREVHTSYTESPRYGKDHSDTLAAAINLGNAQRAVGDLADATERIEKTIARFRESLGPNHPYTHGCRLNLALVHRQGGQVKEAEAMLAEALTGLEQTLGADHHYTLTCVTNLATAKAALGQPALALDMGQKALAAFRDLLGEDHPHTLVCATNVAIDLAATGNTDDAAKLAETTMKRYRRVLGDSHPDVVAGARGERLDFDFEPPPL